MGLANRQIRRHSDTILSPRLTREKLERLITYMQAGIAATAIELTSPLAPDWQERAVGELQTVITAVAQLQALIAHPDSAGFK